MKQVSEQCVKSVPVYIKATHVSAWTYVCMERTLEECSGRLSKRQGSKEEMEGQEAGATRRRGVSLLSIHFYTAFSLYRNVVDQFSTKATTEKPQSSQAHCERQHPSLALWTPLSFLPLPTLVPSSFVCIQNSTLKSHYGIHQIVLKTAAFQVYLPR